MPRNLKRGALLSAAAAAVVFCAAPAQAAQTATFPTNSGVDSSQGMWTGASACGLLCSVGTDWSATGGNPGGRLGMSYATLLGLLNLQAGAATWTSGQFTYNGTAPSGAAIKFDRKATVGTLVSVNGSARLRAGLLDITAGTEVTAVDAAVTANDAAFVPVSGTVAASKLVPGHSYRVIVRGDFGAAVQVAGGARLDVDNVRLEVTTPSAPTPSAAIPGVTRTATGAGLSTTVDPGDVSGTWHIEYGPEGGFGSTTAPQTLAAGSGDVALDGALTGLAPSTAYQARFVYVVGGQTYHGATVHFSTLAPSTPTPPAVVAPQLDNAVPTVDPAETTATIASKVTPGSEAGEWWVQTRTGGGAWVSGAHHNVPAGSSSVDLDDTITGLTAATDYDARIVYKTDSSVTTSAIVSFRTDDASGVPAPPVAPAPSADAPTAMVDVDSAELSTSFTPGDEAVEWYVEYGPEGGFGTETSRVAVAAGSSPVAIDRVLSGLDPDTAYQARFVFVSTSTTVRGQIAHFRTAAEPPVITDPDPGTDPTDPTDPGTDPTDPGTDPTDPAPDPADPGTDPTDPTDPGTTPTDPGTTPTDPGTTPTDPGTTPTDPGTTPTTPTTGSGGTTQGSGTDVQDKTPTTTTPATTTPAPAAEATPRATTSTPTGTTPATTGTGTAGGEQLAVTVSRKAVSVVLRAKRDIYAVETLLPRQLTLARTTKKGVAVGTLKVGSRTLKVVSAGKGRLTVQGLKNAKVTATKRRLRVSNLPTGAKTVTLTIKVKAKKGTTAKARAKARAKVTARIINADGTRSKVLRPAAKSTKVAAKK